MPTFRERIRSSWNSRFWRMMVLIVAVIVLAHVIADRFDTEGANRVLYLTRMGVYLWVFSALFAWCVGRKHFILGQLFLLGALLILTELVFYGVRGWPPIDMSRIHVDPNNANQLAVAVGALPWADSVMHQVKTYEGDTTFDVRYTIDHLNRRHVPGFDSSRTGHALFFGCSVCFGHGLSDEQTLPYRVQEACSDLNAYCYANSGWGTHHMLARLEYQDLAPQVSGDHGVGVYVFIWSHIRRVIGDMRYYNGWGYQDPYYYLDGDSLVRKGNFANDRGFLSWAYEELNRLNTIRYFDPEIPLQVSEADIRLTVAVIKRAQQVYERQFPHDRFHVLIFPDWTQEYPAELRTYFLRLLAEQHIPVLDLSERVPVDDAHRIPNDGHPNALTDSLVARMVVETLQLK